MAQQHTINGVIYEPTPDRKWRVVGYANAPSQGPITIGTPDPYKAANEARLQRQTDIEAGGLGIRQQSNTRDAATMAIKNPQALREEYSKSPEISQYRTALQQAHIALETAPSPQGDVALTYAFAKAMDPNSVVRESETSTAQSTQPWVQSAIENIKKQFGVDGAGNFTPATRNAFRQAILGTVAARKIEYDAKRMQMSDVAKLNHIDPYQVVGKDDTDLYAPAFRQFGEKNGDPQGVISGIIGGEPIKPAPIDAAADGGNIPRMPAPSGSRVAAKPIPPEMQQEQQAYLARHWGNIDPRDYVSFRINQDRKYGFGSDPDGYRQDVTRFNDYAQKGIQPNQVPAIPDVPRPLTDIERFRNDVVSNPIGAATATALNSAGFGIPGLLAPDQMAALRQAHPIAAPIGDIAGGAIGAGLAGRGLRLGAEALANPSVARALSAPLAGDLAYGTIYGGNTAAANGDNPLLGAATGAIGAYAGNKIGSAVGRAFPGMFGFRGAVRRLDRLVPTSQALKDRAAQLYSEAEARGLTANPDETFALADTTSGILSNEGRLSPTGRLTDVQPKVKEAFGLIQDYAGQPMTPTQIQTVRGVISDGRTSRDADERRISRLLLDNFDQWTEATNPNLAVGLTKARDTASRYLQGDQIAKRIEFAEPGAAQYSQSGAGNAIRTQFRQLDRAITDGRAWLPPHVVGAVQDAARGNPLRNGLRWFGKFAPTGVVPTGALALMSGTGAQAAGPVGALPGIALGAIGLGARQAEAALAKRSAQVAENAAYGGPEYLNNLNALLSQSAQRGGRIGTGMFANGAAPRINSLLDPVFLQPQIQSGN